MHFVKRMKHKDHGYMICYSQAGVDALTTQGWQLDDTFRQAEDKPKGKPRGKSKADDINIDDILDGD